MRLSRLENKVNMVNKKTRLTCWLIIDKIGRASLLIILNEFKLLPIVPPVPVFLKLAGTNTTKSNYNYYFSIWEAGSLNFDFTYSIY